MQQSHRNLTESKQPKMPLNSWSLSTNASTKKKQLLSVRSRIPPYQPGHRCEPAARPDRPTKMHRDRIPKSQVRSAPRRWRSPQVPARKGGKARVWETAETDMETVGCGCWDVLGTRVYVMAPRWPRENRPHRRSSGYHPRTSRDRE